MMKTTKCIDCTYCVENQLLYPKTKYGCIVDDVPLVAWLLHREEECEMFVKKLWED